MSFRAWMFVVTLIACLTLAGACSKNASPPREPAEGSEPLEELAGARREPKVLPLPGQQMPAGHPSIGSGPLAWDVPEGWVEVPPASSMRKAQYRVSGPGGDGECIVFHFGPGQGGDPASNAVRWANQFQQPDGSPSVNAMKMTRLKGMPMPVRLVEVTGTYDGGMTMTDAPAERRTGYMLLGTIAEAPNGFWFFKLVGPEETVRAQRESFVGMMGSLRGGA